MKVEKAKFDAALQKLINSKPIRRDEIKVRGKKADKAAQSKRPKTSK
jgi:hypothetical protein